MEFLEIFLLVNLLNILIWLYKIQTAHQQNQSKSALQPEILFSPDASVHWGPRMAWN